MSSTVDPNGSSQILVGIVGVGASAGGLDAFTKFVKMLPTDTGMAFVLIQHLAPAQPSHLADILQRSTTMPVSQAVDGCKLEPNHLYIAPAHVFMTPSNGILKLAELGEPSHKLFLPIDAFLTALAKDQREKAIGIVLSGTGSDGASGLLDIAAEGGVTFAQDLFSSQFSPMPQAAAKGGVDFVLPPEQIAVELGKLAAARRKTPSVNKSSDTYVIGDTIDPIVDWLRSTRGINFAHYKRATLERRIRRRMGFLGIDRTADYLQYIETTPTEAAILYEDILIKVTSFFRDNDVFELLKKEVFPRIIEGKYPESPIRIWIPGCASGEEAYSIAICLSEMLADLGAKRTVQIFATDISQAAVAAARLGVYELPVTNSLTPERLKKFFTPAANGCFQVNKSLREMCVFAEQDVTKDPPFSRIDLISCRNLLIYFDQIFQRRVMTTFHFALNSHGYLLLGSAETVGPSSDFFEPITSGSKVFSRLAIPSRAPDFASEYVANRNRHEAVDESKKKTTELDPVKGDAGQALISKWHLNGAVIDSNMDILQFLGDSENFLNHPPGELASLNFFKMVHQDLHVELRLAIHEATTTNSAVTRDQLRMTTKNDAQIEVSIEVIPFESTLTNRNQFIVLFKQEPSCGNQINLSNLDRSSVGMPNTIAQLTKELAETKTYLNTLIEKEQAANEELKSASEEILSSNEELQSTNQELQTSKEEIQSANSAIESINATLKKRNFELTEAHSDLSNTLSSAQVAIIMLSNDLTCRRRRITPAADRALMLHDPAPGRSITEIMANFEIPDFDKMILNVIDTLSAKKLETQDKSGRWYELSIRPYRTIDNKIDGAVIVLNDINENKRSLIRLEDSQEYGAAIIGTVPVPLLVLDADLRVKSANQCFIESFGIEEDQTTNQLMYEMGRGEWDVPELREFLENILPEKRILRNYVLDRVFPHVGHRVLNLSARRLIQQEQKVPMILLAIEDVSAEHKAKLELKEAKDASDAANKAKSNFLASMSHEIRTPLGIMLGYSDMIYNDAKNKMDRRYFAETIRRNGQHLLAIINDVLDLSKVEAGKLEIDLVRFQLVPKLNDIVDQFMQRAKERGIFLEFKITGSIPDTVTTDPVRLRQILVNILGNAIKFTDKGGVSVDVTMRNPNDAGSQKLVFTITDSGCGIAETCQEKIFNPFTQAESYITRRYGGTGLGLGLAQKLARCLGGDVVLMSSEIGKGSIFIASIDAGDTKSATWIDDVAYKEISQRGSAESPSDSAKVAVEMRLSGIRVLLVDDFEDNQKLIRLMLENVGAQVEVANDGADGVKKALAGHFDIVLMDIQMPVMTGYEATATLRVKGYSQPIVALTAHAMKGELERCIASGCDGYIAKPITKEQLILSIEQHLADDQSITGGNFTEIADSAGDAKVVQSIKKSQSTEDSPLVSTIPITDPTYEVVQQIVSRLSQYVASFQRHLNQCDWTALRDLAHQMKGLGGGIGFPVLTEVARDLEVEAKNDPPNVPRLVALVGEFTALVRRINV